MLYESILATTTYLIPTVMAESFAVLFQREMMSSLPLTDMTAPHISFPTMNCSPIIANSYKQHDAVVMETVGCTYIPSSPNNVKLFLSLTSPSTCLHFY